MSSAAFYSACRVEIWRGGTRVLRFQIPLIKPDGQISSILCAPAHNVLNVFFALMWCRARNLLGIRVQDQLKTT